MAQFNRFCSICIENHLEDYATIACLGRYAGLRMHECFRIDTATAKAALKTKMITFKGKGGLVRSVPITESIVVCLREQLKKVAVGHKLFLTPKEHTHGAMHRLEVFIAENRSGLFHSREDIVNLTFHGLRHTYAAEQYLLFINQGLSAYDARLKVAKLLGHDRADVTKIYLASVKEKC